MMKKIAIISCAALTLGSAAFAKDLSVTVSDEHRSQWLAPEVPVFHTVITDSLGNANTGSKLLFTVTDDTEQTSLLSYEVSPNLPAGSKGSKFDLEIAVKHPGFYILKVTDDGNTLIKRTFAYEPENIVSLPDKDAPEISAFWEKAMAEVKALPKDFTITPAAAGVDSDLCDLSTVEYNTTDSITLRGYLVTPKKKGTYPVIISYRGYGSKPAIPDLNLDSDVITFYPSTRGQYLCEDDSTYGEWALYKIGDPEHYYYRGAYQDVVRAIDVAESLANADPKRIYAEGGSQGGAFAYAAAALDNRIAATAPYIPFMGDFPDYLTRAKAAAPIIDKVQNSGTSVDKLLPSLQWFDLKNLARRISVPVIMGVGLQDQLCPPHTNFAPYNLLGGTVEKEYVIYPDHGHSVDFNDWHRRAKAFLLRHHK